MNLGSPPGRYRARPIQGEPAADQLRAALDPLVKADDAQGAEAQLLTFAPQLSTTKPAPRPGQRVAFVYYVARARHGRPARCRHLAPGRGRRLGAASRLDLRPCFVAAGRLRVRLARLPQVAGLAQQRELRAGGLYWAARRSKRAAGPRPSSRCCGRRASPESFYGLIARETLGMDTELSGRPATFSAIRRSTICPTSSARSSSPGSASRRWPRRCSATRPGSALRPSITP